MILFLIDSFNKCHIMNSLGGTEEDVVGINTDVDSQSKSDSDEAEMLRWI